MSIDQSLRCMFCGMKDGNHLGYCVIVQNITGYSVVPHYADDDEDNAPESEETPASGPDSY